MNKFDEDFIEIPCQCGFTAEKNRDKYEIYLMKIGSIMGKELPKKEVLRCRICKDISFLKRNYDVDEDLVFKGMSSIETITDIIKDSRIPTSFSPNG